MAQIDKTIQLVATRNQISPLSSSTTSSSSTSLASQSTNNPTTTTVVLYSDQPPTYAEAIASSSSSSSSPPPPPPPPFNQIATATRPISVNPRDPLYSSYQYQYERFTSIEADYAEYPSRNQQTSNSFFAAIYDYRNWIALAYLILWDLGFACFCFAWVLGTLLVGLCLLILPPIGMMFLFGAIISWRFVIAKNFMFCKN
ncbi:hypothetical protein G9A89_018504 [Geosiphon pyriformis]|nr:hypothetical protein G9A89_018504 [Geosiphon pyriformis]